MIFTREWKTYITKKKRSESVRAKVREYIKIMIKERSIKEFYEKERFIMFD